MLSITVLTQYSFHNPSNRFRSPTADWLNISQTGYAFSCCNLSFAGFLPLAACLSSFACLKANRFAILSSSVKTAGRCSNGVPKGVTMLLTTCLMCFDTRQPDAMLITSPSRQAFVGSDTRIS
jgi:hypothetical protein